MACIGKISQSLRAPQEAIRPLAQILCKSSFILWYIGTLLSGREIELSIFYHFLFISQEKGVGRHCGFMRKREICSNSLQLLHVLSMYILQCLIYCYVCSGVLCFDCMCLCLLGKACVIFEVLVAYCRPIYRYTCNYEKVCVGKYCTMEGRGQSVSEGAGG